MDVLLLVDELNQDVTPARKAALLQQLAAALNNLVLHDFPALLHLLYRVDVPEKKLKELLAAKPGTDAGELLAGLLLQRLEEKRAARNLFRTPPPADEAERW